MRGIRVSASIDAPAERVWEDVRRIDTHVEWMADAREIRFVSGQREGVGTAFDCDTRIGPLRLLDRMVVTEWTEGSVIGIRHEGLVAGTGRFTLEPAGEGRSRFTWTEELVFPWWMGGRLGALLGRPVLTTVWRRNLRRLAGRFA